MKIDLINFNKFVKVNQLKEVTNPIMYNRNNIPTDDGILSNTIFGISVSDRKESFAYIDLGGHFFHPFIYKSIKRMFRNIEKIVSGSANYKIDSNTGFLVESEDGETGIEFLYNNWNKIKWKRNDSTMRNERIDLLEAYTRDEIFTPYWLVIPAYYRDMNLQKKEKSHEEINDEYCKLMRLCDINKNNNDFDFVIFANQMAIQQKLVDIYNHFKVKKVEKKNGFIRKSVKNPSADLYREVYA